MSLKINKKKKEKKRRLSLSFLTVLSIAYCCNCTQNDDNMDRLCLGLSFDVVRDFIRLWITDFTSCNKTCLMTFIQIKLRYTLHID